MKTKRFTNVLNVLLAVILASLSLWACAPQAPVNNDAAVKTLVAMTVQAQQPVIVTVVVPPTNAPTALPANFLGDQIGGQIGTPTTQPTASATSTPNAPAAIGGSFKVGEAVQVSDNGQCKFPTPDALDAMPKTTIDQFNQNVWTHRVYNNALFNQQNNWGGADSWEATLAIGANSGGGWTSYGNPGEVIYRATNTTTNWCLGILTSSQYKAQFLSNSNPDLPVAINIRITPFTAVYVRTVSGNVYSQLTSDGGDLTVVLPDDGVVSIWATVTTVAPTFETRIHWGPYDRSAYINTLHAER